MYILRNLTVHHFFFLCKPVNCVHIVVILVPYLDVLLFRFIQLPVLFNAMEVKKGKQAFHHFAITHGEEVFHSP